MKESTQTKTNKGFAIWAGLLSLTLGLLSSAGFIASSILFQEDIPEPVERDPNEPDMKVVMARYEQAKAKGDFSTLAPEDAVNATFHLLSQEENYYTVTVGQTKALWITQHITAYFVKMGNHYFEESNSSGYVNLYDRMIQEGDTTTTYWGNKPDYANHEPVVYSNKEYREMMGRNLSEPFLYIVSEQTKLETGTSGDSPSRVIKENDGYRIELELDPLTSVLAYQCTMQSLSNLKYKPTFDFVHLTITTDVNLNVLRMDTHEKYFATSSSGMGSKCEAWISTAIHHEKNPIGFPSYDSQLPEYPESL